MDERLIALKVAAARYDVASEASIGAMFNPDREVRMTTRAEAKVAKAELNRLLDELIASKPDAATAKAAQRYLRI